MFTPRRLYIYLVSAISLQAFAWALIDLLRAMLISPISTDAISLAWHIAVIIVSLPVFLVHWLWGQRLAKHELEEREASLRVLYLYGMQASFLGPIIASTFWLVNTLFLWIAGRPPLMRYPELSSGEALLFFIVPILVLGLLWFYHQRIIQQDAKAVKYTGGSATIRRLYALAFSAVGLTMTTMGFIYLLRWLMMEIGGGDISGELRLIGYLSELTRLLVGIPLWLAFWLWVQRLFYGGDDEERRSALRKIYLYAVIFVAVISTVASITFILEGLFSSALGVTNSSTSNGDVGIPISIIIPMLVLWLYHQRVLKADIELTEEVERQAGLRRLYYYLIAAIGLSAFLVGTSGILSVLIRSLDYIGFNIDLRQELSWYASVLIAGLPLWLIPWRQAQVRARVGGPEGASERRSTVRTVYLYFFLFIAAITLLSSVVYIVFSIVSLLLGELPPIISDLAQAVAFMIIALLVWFYHWTVLSEDRKKLKSEVKVELEQTPVVYINDGRERYNQMLVKEISQQKKDISFISIDISEVHDPEKSKDLISRINEASIIICSWEVLIADHNEREAAPGVTTAVINSPAVKLLVPTRSKGWEWAWVDEWKTSFFVRQTVNSVKQIIENRGVKPVRPLGTGAIIGIVFGVIFLLLLVGIPIVGIFLSMFF